MEKKLTERFQLQAYKTMNHVLGSIDITRNGESFEEIIQSIKASIHIFSIDSDLFFPLSEDQETVRRAQRGWRNNQPSNHSFRLWT